MDVFPFPHRRQRVHHLFVAGKAGHPCKPSPYHGDTVMPTVVANIGIVVKVQGGIVADADRSAGESLL